jgi:hypothetical protein
MSRGPLEFVVVEFTGEIPGAQLAPELKRLVDQEIVRIIDILFVKKEADGRITTHELSEFAGNPEFEALDSAIQSVDGLITETDVSDLAADLEPGVTAGVLLFEHLWVTGMRAAIEAAGGQIVFTERIPGPVVDAIEGAAEGILYAPEAEYLPGRSP